MNMVDSHSHLFLEEFSEDLPQVIARAKEAGVTHIFMPNIDSTTLEPMLKVCSEYKGCCFPMIGLHPTSVNEHYEKELAVVKQQLESDEAYVAIGEIGMDLHWDKAFWKEQEMALDQQLRWALEYELPVVIHCREALDCLYKVILPYKDKLAGIMHSFTGTAEEAALILDFPGLYIGINGVVTFKNSTLPQVLPHIPLSRLVLETDAPYLAPVPCRGRRNESAYLKHTLEKVAGIYGMPSEEVARLTTENALKVFGMSRYGSERL